MAVDSKERNHDINANRASAVHIGVIVAQGRVAMTGNGSCTAAGSWSID